MKFNALSATRAHTHSSSPHAEAHVHLFWCWPFWHDKNSNSLWFNLQKIWHTLSTKLKLFCSTHTQFAPFSKTSTSHPLHFLGPFLIVFAGLAFQFDFWRRMVKFPLLLYIMSTMSKSHTTPHHTIAIAIRIRYMMCESSVALVCARTVIVTWEKTKNLLVKQHDAPMAQVVFHYDTYWKEK